MSEPSAASPFVAHLRPGHVQPVWAGHPWVFAQAVARIEGHPSAGDTVDVRDPRGNHLGRGWYSPGSAIPVRIATRGHEDLETDFVRTRIETAARWRRSVLGLPNADTDGYRLIHAEGDGLPGVIVDVFGASACVQLLTIGAKKREAAIVDAVMSVTGVTSVVEAASPRHQKLEGFTVTERVVRGEARDELVFRELGIAHCVNRPGATGGGQKTGYFFDQRETRAMAAALSPGRRVLDVFSYVGGFSLGAARAGAASVTAIDASASAIASLQRTVERNGLEGKVTAHTGDALATMDALRAQEQRFDLVVTDPPRFANNARDVEEATRHYRRVNAMAVRLLAPEGLLVACSCSQAVGGGEFLRAVAAGARDAGKDLVVVRTMGQAPDHPVLAAFPEGRYLKVIVGRVV